MDTPRDTLFDVCMRSSMRWRRQSESLFAYLNQSGRPEWETARAILERWFQRYPSEDRNDLRGRFRKGGKPTDGAFFELLLHEFFRKLGCKMELHPDVPGTTKHPDFLVCHGGKEFYLESVARSETESQFAHDIHTKDALDKLNSIPSQHFGVVVKRVEGTLKADISTHRIQKPFLECLKELDPSAYREGETIPGFVQVEEGGWLLKGSLVRISRSADFPPEDDQFILMYPSTGGWDNTPAEMLNVLQRKAKRYGEPELPIVIALNWNDTLGSAYDESAVVEALYAGHVDNDRKPPPVRVQYRTDTGEPVGIGPGEPKKGSGLFRRVNGDPKYSRVAAVLMFHGASLYLNYLSCSLYLNSNATGELPRVLRQLRHVAVGEGKGERQYNEGITISTLARGVVARANSLSIPLEGKRVLEWHDGKTASGILGIDAGPSS